jgi:hypothetical protein
MGKGIAPDIIQCRKVCTVIYFYAGDGTAGVPGAQQDTQSAAAGSQVHHRGLLWQSDKIGQKHGICTQRKSVFGDVQSETA